MDRKGGRARIRWWVDGKGTRLRESGLRQPGLLEALLADPDRVLQGPGSVARARVGRKRFYRVAADRADVAADRADVAADRADVAADRASVAADRANVAADRANVAADRALYVKVFTVPPGMPRLRSLARPSKARREARVARSVEQLGFEVAGPIAWGEERRLGLLLRSFSVVPEVDGRDLRDLLRDPALGCARRRRLLRAAAELARRLHDAGVDQDDFSPNNFLATADDRLVLIDFERCSVTRPLAGRRFELLAKLHRHDLGISRSDRLRFLAWYLGAEAGRRERRAAWTAIARAFRHVRARDARRAGRAAFRVGRHVRRSGSEWVVAGRERAPVLRLVLGPEPARRAWVRAHQLERLGLPALRPVRLGDGWLELEAPATPPPGERDQLVARARRTLERYGRFTRDPEWAFLADGARLRDPLAFELRLE